MGSCCITQGTQPGALGQHRGWNGVGGGKEGQEEEDICISMADCWYIAETNIML